MTPEPEQTTCLFEATSPQSIQTAGNPAHQLVPASQSATVISAGPVQIAPATDPPGKPRPRLGKVARLPKLYRDMVSRMLRNNCTYRHIVDALEELGVHVTQRNISNWRTLGGYHQWCLDEDRAAEVRLVQDRLLQYHRKDDATHIAEVGLQAAATNIAGYMLSAEGAQQVVTDPETHARLVSSLCRVNGELNTLQKQRDEASKALGYKHNPERVRRENEQEVEEIREAYTSTPGRSAREDSTPYRNYTPATSISERPVPRPVSEEEQQRQQMETLQAVAQIQARLQGNASPPPATSMGSPPQSPSQNRSDS